MTLSKRLPCYITIEDEVNAVVSGLHPTDSDKLYNRYGILAANHYFHPKYKLGIWDGKIRFFQQSGKTLTYLLDELVVSLLKMGYLPKISDKRKGPYVPVSPITEHEFSHILDKEGNPTVLRYYQVDSINALIADGKGLVEAATSAGKTILSAGLVNAYGKRGLRTITIVPSTSLVIQTMEDFVRLGLDVGEYSGKVKELEHQHIVCTWQAIQKHPHLMQTFQVVVVDEVHQAKGKVLQDLVNVHGKDIPYRFGLTGTIPKDSADKMTIHAAFGDVKYTIPAHVLQEQEYIASVEINVSQLYENHPDGYFPDYTAEKSYLQIRKERLAWIADSIIKKSELPKGNSFVLVSSVAVGKKLEKLIPNSVFLCGKDAADDRKQVYDLFEHHNNLVVIATVNIAGTGLSINRIFHLFFIDIGKSFTRVIQSIGRGLRKSGDKDHVYVYDICSSLKYSKKHLKLRLQFYTEAKYPFKKHIVKYRDYENDTFDMTQDDILARLEDETSLDY